MVGSSGAGDASFDVSFEMDSDEKFGRLLSMAIVMHLSVFS